MDFTWKDRVNGVDDVDSEDINSVGRAVEALSKEQILEITLDNKVLTKNAKKINIPLATDSENGAMSAQDKKKLDDLELSKFKGNIESISANGTPLEPDKNKNVDIPLSNSEQDGLISAEDKAKLDKIDDGAQVNVQSDWNQTDDTKDDYIKNKPNNLATETYVDEKLASQIGQKVDKEEGKGLSTNDFTDEYKEKIDGVEDGAQVNKIDGISANGTPITIQKKTAMLPITVNPKGWCTGLTHDEDETGIIPLQQSVAITNNEINYFSDYEVNSYGYIGITLNLDTFINDKNVNGHTEDEELHMANAEFIFKTPTNAITFSYPSELKFIGLDVEDGVFVPQPNMKYDVIFSWCKESNFAPIGYVSGYELPTNEVS